MIPDIYCDVIYEPFICYSKAYNTSPSKEYVERLAVTLKILKGGIISQ